MRLTLYRSASAGSPYLGRSSFWTTSEKNARAYADPEADHGVYQVLGEYVRGYDGPSRVDRAEVEVDDSAVIDTRDGLIPTSPDLIAAAAERLARQGFEWVLLAEEVARDRWTVAIYLGDEPVPASRVTDEEVVR